MKKINIKLFGLLCMLGLGNSTYLIPSQSLNYSDSDEEAEYYSFIQPNEYSMHDLDVSSLIDPLESDSEYILYDFYQDDTDQAFDETTQEPFPNLTSVNYLDPDTLVITETSLLTDLSQPQQVVTVSEIAEPDFAGSEHERKHSAHELIHETRQELHDAHDLLNTTEHQLEQLEHNHAINAGKKGLKQDIIEKNITHAQTIIATATKQIQRLAHSTDKIIQKEFGIASNKLTRQLHETTNRLDKVVKKANRQLKKIFK